MNLTEVLAIEGNHATVIVSAPNAIAYRETCEAFGVTPNQTRMEGFEKVVATEVNTRSYKLVIQYDAGKPASSEDAGVGELDDVTKEAALAE